jgi:hypothetical protein
MRTGTSLNSFETLSRCVLPPLVRFFPMTACTSKIFKEATLFFSSETPSLPAVIPVMDKIDKYLSDCENNTELSPALQKACGLGKSLLNKYYSLTDMSNLYRIAIGTWNLIYFVFPTPLTFY